MSARLRVGVAGLGRAFTLMVPTFMKHPRVRLVAAADPRPDARARFAQDFGGRVHDTVKSLCADEQVDAIYVATPHQHHAAHAIAAALAGKHVLVEKPMALSLQEANDMIDAAETAGVRLVVGPSHAFDTPIARARAIVASGELGRVRMVTALNFTDFLYRPRRSEELATDAGGGVLFSQAAHQVDIVRLLAGGMATRVRTYAGSWDPARPTEGAYGALVGFEDGAFATLTYSGYAHFDSDDLCGNTSELGFPKTPAGYGNARRALASLRSADEESIAKAARIYGGAHYQPNAAAPWHEHFGIVVVSCERGDIRPLPNGVHVYGDLEQRFEPLARPAVPRAEVLDALCETIAGERATVHDGAWGRATLAVCLAMLDSSRTGREVAPGLQVPVG